MSGIGGGPQRPTPGPLPANPETRGILVDKRVGSVDVFENALSFGRLKAILQATLEAAALRPGDALVDIGCGSGRLVIAASRLHPGDRPVDALGIDATPGMIKLARRRTREAGAAARFEVGVAERLPLVDASVDAVTSSYFFHHLPPEVKVEALREMWRVLKPGGRLVITDYGRPRSLLGWIAAFPMRFNFYEYTRPQLRGELEAIIAAEGLGPIEVKRVFLGYIVVLRVLKPPAPGSGIGSGSGAADEAREAIGSGALIGPGARAGTATPEPPTARRMLTQAAGSLVLIAAAFAFIAVAASGKDIGAILASFSASTILILIGLAAGNYAARTARWILLFRSLDPAGPGSSPRAIPRQILVYLGGFALTLTPGRAGEVVRAWMANRSFATPPANGASLVIADRFYDALALAVILAVTGALLARGLAVPAVTAGVLVATVAALGWLSAAPAFWNRLAGWRPWLARPVAATRQMIGSLAALSRPRRMPLFALPSLAGWTLQGLAPALILEDLGVSLGWSEAIFIFVLATLVGGASFLPGGLGGFELTMIGLFTAAGVDPSDAVVATLGLRLTTLWFGVSLGMAALAAWFALGRRSEAAIGLQRPSATNWELGPTPSGTGTSVPP